MYGKDNNNLLFHELFHTEVSLLEWIFLQKTTKKLEIQRSLLPSESPIDDVMVM